MRAVTSATLFYFVFFYKNKLYFIRISRLKFAIKLEASEAEILNRTKLVVFENSVNTVQFIQYVLNLTVEN